MTETPRATLSTLLFEHPFADDEELLYGAGVVRSAGQARADAEEVAQRLRDAGVRPGQPVAVQLPNGPAVVTAMMGIWRMGGVFVPVNPRYPAAEVDRVVAATRPAALLRPGDLRALPGAAVHPGDVAFVLWTSGTTGAPKAILHTHTAYFELLDRVLGPLRGGEAAPARRPAPNLIPVSLALNAGIYNVLFGLRAGAALVILESFTTAGFAEAVHRFGIRSTVLPPPAMVMLSDDAAVTDLQPLKYVRSITAPLSVVQARRFADRFGVYVLNSYGQAEMGEVIGWTAADAKSHPEKLGAAGRPHAGVGIRIVGQDGTAVPTGEVGLLLVRPPSLAAGYAGGDRLDDRLDAGGYLDTGDLARIDEDGFVWIEGRAGDLINRGGNKVFPDEVEDVLRLSPAVADAAVVARADERLGQVPVAFLVGDRVPDTDLEKLCRDHLVAYKVPVAFEWVGAIPRNEAGKIQRRQLSDHAGRR